MTRIYLQPHEAWTFARLPDVLADHDITPHVVAHIGAHHGEEVAVYQGCGFTQIYLVEPDPRSVAVLHERYASTPNIAIIAAAVVPTADTGQATLHYADRSVWSGLHPHPTATGHTVTVPTVAIGDLPDTINVLVLDTQGSELDLLAAADLASLDLVIVETTRRAGDGAAYYADAVSMMDRRGWTVAEEWVHDGSGYTDTVFVPAS